MPDHLFDYYERELRFLRLDALEFKNKHGAAADQLGIEPERADPHVERLLQGCALLGGRIHQKLDDEFPELTEALLEVLYPHYLRPIPSLAIVQFELDPMRGAMREGFRIARHSRLHTAPVEYLPEKRIPCRFQTCYPVHLWPIASTFSRFQRPPFPDHFRPPPKTEACLHIHLECQSELNFSDMDLDCLRFYLLGDNLVYTLYELLFNHTIQVAFCSADRNLRIEPVEMKPEECLKPVGFEPEESLLPYKPNSFLGYRVLSEFFSFPNKFFFLDLEGWNQVRQKGFQRKAEVVFYLNRTERILEQGINNQTFQLGCTPVINLFEKTVEGIPLTQTHYEYRIVPDVEHTRGLEVYSVETVTSLDSQAPSKEYQPFYSFRHGQNGESQQAFWYATRQPSTEKDDRGTEVYLNLVDLQFQPRLPAESVIVVRTHCTNRDVPILLQRAGKELFLELEGAAPYSRIHCLRSPTTPLRPPWKQDAHWRLISHLCLNHLSLTNSRDGCEALKEILRLYNFAESETGQELGKANLQMIEGISSLFSNPVVRRTGGSISSGFARGIEVTIDFDETKYAGKGLFLFATILERFLCLYVSINSFTQLTATMRKGEVVIKQWPPRAGEVQLL